MATKASEKYYTILTRTGQAKIANALAYGRKISFTHFALGDGGGASYDPDENQTALKNEVYRAAVANVLVSDESIGMLEINMAVPADIGGFTVREMGIFDEAGDLICIAKTPDDPKPTAASGAAKDVVYRLFIILSNTDAIEIRIDPTVTVATKEEVRAALATSKKYTDETAKETNHKLTAHTTDSAIHVTRTEKAAWNANAGLDDKETVFNADGSITEVSGAITSTTVFNSDGSITETVVDEDNRLKKTITTTFEGDSIKEEVVMSELG